MAFITGAVGMSWALRGFPMNFSAPIGAAQLVPMLDARFGDHSAQEFERKAWENTQTAQSDKDAARDTLRLDLLQAANAYAQSPCDQTMKANLVAALSAYTRAWQRKLDCVRPMNMLIMCGDKKIREAAAAFGTPLDAMVKTAVAKATEQGGIVKTDFPDSLQFDVLKFAGPGLWQAPSPVCRWATEGGRRGR